MKTITNVGRLIERLQKANAKTARLGIDQHARNVVVAVKLDESQAQRAQRLEAAELLAVVRALVAAGVRVSSCYEAGPCGFVLHRALEAAGARNVVVAPQSLAEGKRQKTDALDALALVERLYHYEHGGRRAFTVAHVPEPEQEQARAQGRLREALKRDRQAWEARGRSLLLAQGWHITGRWWGKSRWPKLAEELPGWLVGQLGVMREAILALDAQERAQRETLEKQAGARLPKGVGALSWVLALLEACAWTRFRNRRQVASYTGLCPGIHQTGATRREGCINRHGNPRLRALLIELVWRLARWQPGYPPVRKLVAGELRGAARRKAAVAAARRLAVDLWRLATGRTTPENLGLVMA
jgi:transposase